jgi:hypothetical protein
MRVAARLLILEVKCEMYGGLLTDWFHRAEYILIVSG